MTVKSPFTWYKSADARVRRVFWTCSAAWALDSMDALVYSFMIPTLMVAFGMSLTEAQAINTANFVAAAAGGWLGGLNRPESLAIACGINARGSTEVIVATIGLSMGALSQDLFTMIVTMAVVTTMAMPPMLRAALRRLPLREEERLRLEREAIAAKGFVTRLERLLLAVDDSAKGRFAARVTGLLAAQRGAPVDLIAAPALQL